MGQSVDDSVLASPTGTIQFDMPGNAFEVGENLNRIFVDKSCGSRRLRIVKRDEGFLRVRFWINSHAYITMECSILHLSTFKKHNIAFTWNISKGKYRLFLDGEKMAVIGEVK